LSRWNTTGTRRDDTTRHGKHSCNTRVEHARWPERGAHVVSRPVTAKSISTWRERFPGWLSGKYCFALGYRFTHMLTPLADTVSYHITCYQQLEVPKRSISFSLFKGTVWPYLRSVLYVANVEKSFSYGIFYSVSSYPTIYYVRMSLFKERLRS